MVRALALSGLIAHCFAMSLAAQVRVPDVREHWVRSDLVDHTYRVTVGVPDGYSSSSGPYPVLVVLDAEKSFGLVRDVADWFAWEDQIEPVIVVGISYGEDTAAWWRLRGRDLTPSLDSVGPYGRWQDSGGAEEFRSFLRDDILPLIDREYRTTSVRGLVGLSFGGLFGTHDLFAADRLFQRYLLVSSALAWDDNAVASLEANYAARSARLPVRMYTAIGSADNRNIVDPWRALDAAMTTRGYEALQYESEVFADESHISVFPLAVAHGLKFLFGVAR